MNFPEQKRYRSRGLCQCEPESHTDRLVIPIQGYYPHIILRDDYSHW